MLKGRNISRSSLRRDLYSDWKILLSDFAKRCQKSKKSNKIMPTVDIIKRNEGRNLCSRIEKDEAFVNK